MGLLRDQREGEDKTMVMLGDEGRESGNILVTGRAHQVVEMKMENDVLDETTLHAESEMEKEKGKQSEEGRTPTEVGWEEEPMVVEEEERGAEGETRIEDFCDGIGGYNKETPPVDDVCPICFGRFTIPCRSNCGHWFCAHCILELWKFRSSTQPCTCPMCSCQIVNLKPEAPLLIQPADDKVDVLKKVHQYNGLYISGVLGTFHRMLALPLFMGRIFRVLIDPDGLRYIYYVMRIVGLVLALLYERWEFEFVPTGGLGIQRMFDMSASMLVLTLFSISVGYRWVIRRRARRLATIQARA